jgi:DnaJ-class molecular chaperone
LAKQYHPDSTDKLSKELKKEFEEKFKNVSAAYEILGDAFKK